MNEAFALAGITANNVNFLAAIRETDIIGLLCLTACAALSVLSWTIIIGKTAQLHRAASQSDAFLARCMGGAGSLDEAYREAARYRQSPLARILREAYLEMEMEGWYSGEMYRVDERLTISRLGLERVMERTISQEIRHLESYLIFLATTSSVAPFIGLFGTVWGVLGAFQALSTSGGAAGIQTLAPGMATALTAVIMGLVAAIPASVFYNYLTNHIAVLVSRMDAFALELMNILQKRMLKQGAPRGGRN